MNSELPLKIAPCDRKAAEYAQQHWHYSTQMPAGKNVYYGVWEYGRFIGAVMYGSGTSPFAHTFLNLKRTEVCELVRVALARHQAPVSKIVAVSMRLLKRGNPGLRAVVSFADTEQGHIGGIYQAGNWTYLGASNHVYFVIHGKRMHSRNVYERFLNTGDTLGHIRRYVDPKAERRATAPKHKYAIALDPTTRAVLQKMGRSFPKRAASIESDAAAFQADQGGATPTAALQID